MYILLAVQCCNKEHCNPNVLLSIEVMGSLWVIFPLCQVFAHGSLSWLPDGDEGKRAHLGAMIALVRLGAYSSIQSLCEDVFD